MKYAGLMTVSKCEWRLIGDAAEISVGFGDIRFLMTLNSVSLDSVCMNLLRQFFVCLCPSLSPFHFSSQHVSLKA